MSFNAPQGGSTGHAQGAYPGRVDFPSESFGQEGPEASDKVPNPQLSNRDQSITNRVADIDFNSVAKDMPGDRDYDDPYPGGPTKTLGVPGDG